MAGGGETFPWLSDYVVGILKSPTWVTPISQFIDERCGIFDEGEENGLECTQCHNDFKQLVNDLFTSHLIEVSVTPEQFDRFCETGLADKQQLHGTLVEQLLSVDDFLTFKAMMAKQNADMCREVYMCGPLDDEGEWSEPASPTQLVADLVVRKSISDGISGSDEDWKLYESQLFRTMATESGNDEDSLAAQQRCEEAELEKAIALSLQLEEERLRHLIANEDLLAEAREEALATTSTLPPVEVEQQLPPAAGFTSSPLVALLPQKLQMSGKLQLSGTTSMPRMVQMEPPLSIKPHKWGFTSAPLQYAMPFDESRENSPILTASAPPNSPPRSPYVPLAAGFISSPLCFCLPKRPAIAEAVVPAENANVTGQQPAEPAIVTNQQPQMEVVGMRSNLNQWRDRAERAIAPPPTRVPTRLRLATPVPAVTPAGPTDEERRQRAEHLAKQRDRLIAKRNKEREQQLAQFQNGRSTRAPLAAQLDRASEGIAATRRLVAERTPGAVMATPGAPVLPDPPAAAERMRQALTVQLRQTLMRSMPSDAGVLDGQLSQLESMKQSPS